ncbi:MAG: hypothetical protein AB1797_02670 [bacterium]
MFTRQIKKLISGMILMSIVISPVWAEENKLCRLKVDTSLRPITIAGIQESELIFRPDPNTVLYSASFSSEQSFGLEESKKEKTKKKGRIIGTIVGAGIGGGIGGCLFIVVCIGVGGEECNPSPLIIIVPTVIGGFIGYKIGEYFDKKEGSR